MDERGLEEIQMIRFPRMSERRNKYRVAVGRTKERKRKG